jgi:uncharacterized membrane protein YobD (UPF0266 family)
LLLLLVLFYLCLFIYALNDHYVCTFWKGGSRKGHHVVLNR